jgi:enamine deaminase RidA (YjgF/YER057c/UK114 family)
MKRIFATMIMLCTGCPLFSQDTGHVTRSNPATLFDPTPFAFAHGTSTQGSGRYVFISGQSGGEDLQHHLSKDFRTQVQYALKNLQTVLGTYGLQVGDVLKITVLIVDHDDRKLKIWKEEMLRTWGKQGFPASTLIPVPGLALAGMQVEVDAIAFAAGK